MSKSRQVGLKKTSVTTEVRNTPSFFTAKRALKTLASKKATSTKVLPVKEVLDMIGAKMNLIDYIQAPEDKPHLVLVKPVSILGDDQYGLFAKKSLKTGTLLGRYTGKKYSKAAYRRHLDVDKNATPHYAMEVSTGIICSEQMGNFTRFANCSSSQPNTTFVRLPDGGVGLKAIRDVEEAQQLLVDYNGPFDLPSEGQLFLNPEDGPLSTAELYCEHNKHYLLKSSPENYPSLSVKKGDKLYVTLLIRYLMENRPLETLRHYEPAEVNLLCLKATKTGMVKLAATQVSDDPFTPLMLACYLGQLENVRFLIQNGAGVNHQQNCSGKSPLFFALDGYKEAGDKNSHCREIILELLKGQALISTHDSNFRTFLHQASLVLEPADLEIVLAQLNMMGIPIRESFELVDSDARDIVMVCLEARRFTSLAALLKYYPGYFGDQFLPKIGGKKDLFTQGISDILNAYTPEEAHAFFDRLTSAGIARLDLAPLSDLIAKADFFESEQEQEQGQVANSSCLIC